MLRLLHPAAATPPSPWPMPRASHARCPLHPLAAPGVQRASLSEYARLVAELKKIVDTVDVKEPWKTPNAAELDATTFQSW